MLAYWEQSVASKLRLEDPLSSCAIIIFNRSLPSLDYRPSLTFRRRHPCDTQDFPGARHGPSHRSPAPHGNDRLTVEPLTHHGGGESLFAVEAVRGGSQH